MDSICIIGSNKIFSSVFSSLGYDVHEFGRNSNIPIDFTDVDFKHNFSTSVLSRPFSLYLVCSGLLRSLRLLDQTRDEICESFLVNSVGPITSAELIFRKYSNARVFLIGSESGHKGSFDTTYSLAKSTLTTYVKNKRLMPLQQLLLISPSTISDFGMTKRRDDVDRLNVYQSTHPKKRFLKGREFAEIIHNLYQSSIYICNTEIEVNGGKFALKS